MLILVATPIGNLLDFSQRAIDTLMDCDLILCEDTRHSQKLLNHYRIEKPLLSYHKFNEASRQERLLDKLRKGETIAMISDAGTPGISDPGQALVQACREEGIPVSGIPGPNAALLALACSGLPTDLFQFIGFLPKKKEELRRTLFHALEYPGTTITYLPARDLKEVLTILCTLDTQRRIAIARELTKKFETYYFGVAENLRESLTEEDLKGECVLLISGQKEEESSWEHLTPEEHVALIQEEYGLTRKEAIQHVAKLRGASKREIYNEVHGTK